MPVDPKDPSTSRRAIAEKKREIVALIVRLFPLNEGDLGGPSRADVEGLAEQIYAVAVE